MSPKNKRGRRPRASPTPATKRRSPIREPRNGRVQKPKPSAEVNRPITRAYQKALIASQSAFIMEDVLESCTIVHNGSKYVSNKSNLSTCNTLQEQQQANKANAIVEAAINVLTDEMQAQLEEQEAFEAKPMSIMAQNIYS